jgi:predicted phage tail protein
MRTVQLAGELGERFGAHWELDIRTPVEALKAIEANRPGFAKHMIDAQKRGVGYAILLDDRCLSADDLPLPCGREIIHVVPVVSGGSGDDLFGVVLGAALIWATAGGATSWLVTSAGASVGVASVVGNIGMALALGGAARMLAGTPEKPALAESVPGRESYYFNGPVNTAAQGQAVPIGYGKLHIGSLVISAGAAAENI